MARIQLSSSKPGSHPAAAHSIEHFCRGWHINTLLEPDQLRQVALRAGFRHVSTLDLSPYLEIGRPRDRAIAILEWSVDRVRLLHDKQRKELRIISRCFFKIKLMILLWVKMK